MEPGRRMASVRLRSLWLVAGLIAFGLVAGVGTILVFRAADPGFPPTVSVVTVESPTAADRLAAAASANRQGYFEPASAGLEQLLSESLPALDRQAVALELARSYLNARDYEAAIDRSLEFLARYPVSASRLQALALLARAQQGNGDVAAWTDTYRRIATEDALLAPTMNLAIAREFDRSGEGEAALAAVREILDDSTASIRSQIAARELRASALTALGSFSQAATEFRRLEQTAPANRRGEFLFRRAEALENEGDVAAADATLLRLMNELPTNLYAKRALNKLENERPGLIPDRTHALIHYFHGPATEAVVLLGQVVADGADEELDEIRLYYARMLVQIGSVDEAVEQLAVVLPSSTDASILSSVNFELGSIAESRGDLDMALTYYRPGGELLGRLSAESAYRAGRIPFRSGDFASARDIWRELGQIQLPGESRNRLLFWAAKAADRLGQAESADALLVQLATSRTLDYYVLRSKSSEPFSVDPFRADHTRAISGSFDFERDLQAADNWMRWWAGLPAGGPAPHLIDGAFLQDYSLRRYLRLAEIGLLQEARRELATLLDRYRGDPHRLYQIAVQTERIGDPQLSIAAGRALLEASPIVDPVDLPQFVLRLLYPVEFLTLLNEQSKAYNVDPFLVAALVRQESLFNPTARSSAGALGLTQVIPPTGQEIAALLRLDDYDHADLIRPYLSLQFGTSYLRRMISYFDGNASYGLAAYNGGAGNVDRWTAGNPPRDIDEFVERIGFSETRSYVKLVYQHYRGYQIAYSSVTARPNEPAPS